MEDLIEKSDSTSETAEEVVETTTEQDPLKTELERVQNTGGRTEVEKAAFSLKKNAERLKELGGDPEAILGIEKPQVEETVDEDDKPVTVGMLKKMQQDTTTKTALQLAEELPTETERELAKWHLKNTIKSTGNPAEDLALVRTLVNAAKNKQIIEEVERKTPPKNHSSSSSAPLKSEGEESELTKEEVQLMNFGHLTKEEVIKSRPK